MEFYEYKDRKPEDQVDWSKISKGISDTMMENSNNREDLKAKIDQQSAEFEQKIAGVPVGEDERKNTQMVNFSSDLQSVRLYQEKMLKTGKWDLRQYNLARQNSVTGTDTLFAITKDYNTAYADKTERMRTGKAQTFESVVMSEAERLMNSEGASPIVDQETGVVSAATRNADGSVANKKSLSELRNWVTAKFDRPDITKMLQQGVSTIGEIVTRELKGRAVTETKSIADNDNYKSAKESFIRSIVDNGFNASSTLVDGGVISPSGEAWRFARDSKDIGKYVIQYGKDPKNPTSTLPVPLMTPDQKKAAYDKLAEQFDSMVSEEVGITNVISEGRQQREETASDRNEKKTAILSGKYGDAIVGIYKGGDAELKAGMDYLKAHTKKKITGMKKEGSTLQMNVDGVPVSIDLSAGGNAVVSSLANVIDSDIQKELETGYDFPEGYNPNSKGYIDEAVVDAYKPLSALAVSLKKGKAVYATDYIKNDVTEGDAASFTAAAKKIGSKMPKAMQGRMKITLAPRNQLIGTRRAKDATVIQIDRLMKYPIIVPSEASNAAKARVMEIVNDAIYNNEQVDVQAAYQAIGSDLAKIYNNTTNFNKLFPQAKYK